jgi:alpha-beta hydrolase superfamily lysophospholipase
MYETFRFASPADGKMITAYAWNDVPNPVGILQICHGMAEHATRYDDFARYLNGRSYIVYADDSRGHGATAGSPEEYGHVCRNCYSIIVEDENTLSGLARDKHPGLPFFYMGHSYGSLLTQEYVIRHSRNIDGMIISGSVCLAGRGFEAVLGKAITSVVAAFKGVRAKSKFIDGLTFGNYEKKIRDPRTSYDWLSHDEAVVDAYIADPYCGGVFPLDFYLSMFTGLIEIGKKKRIKSVRHDLPILIFAGSEDPVSNYAKDVFALKDWYAEAGLTDIATQVYEGYRHETLNEIGKERVYADVAAWLDKHRK